MQYSDPFSYATWAPGTNITMCNVPWDSNYRDIVRFADSNACTEYLRTRTGSTIRIEQMTYAKFGQPIRLEVPFTTAQKYNYIRAYNPAQGGNDAVAYFYFILDVVYVSPSVTHVYVQVDVWQTFGYDVKFGRCYIDRGHVGIAHTNTFANYGRDYLTVPEGLDIGGEYMINKQYSETIASAAESSGPELNYSIMMVTTANMGVAGGTVDEPVNASATGSQMQNMPNGAEIYIFYTMAEWNKFLNDYSDKPWVTSGIISVNAIPNPNRYSVPLVQVTFPGTTASVWKPTSGTSSKLVARLAPNWRDVYTVENLPERYRRLRKFLTFPYMVLELTTYTGQPLVIKPEMWNDISASVVEMAHLAPPNQRITMYPFRYGAGANSPAITDSDGVVNDGGEFLDMATHISNFPAFSVVNNAYLGYMASNANSIAYQHQSADWSQQKALTGNQLAHSQANSSIQTSRDLTGVGIGASQQQTALQNQTMGQQAMLNAGAGIVGGIAGGPAGIGAGVAKAAMTGVHTGISQNANTQAMNISTGAARNSNTLSTNNAIGIADSNRQYSDYAARGDYENQIAGINAKVQDAKMIQPTTSGQMGGESFLLSNYRWGYDLKIKGLTGAALNSIGEYWLRYGYAVNRFGQMPDNFMVATHFTYWKLKETYITQANCPEPMKQAIRGIFEKGVTVWSNPDDIGRIDNAINIPIEGNYL